MDGIINIYKPSGMTSFDVVSKIRHAAKTKKVGHTGTLDPLACGVLPICIGKATKIVDYIMVGKKTYITELKLGVITDTYDMEGTVVATKDVQVTEEQVKAVICKFVGNIMQVPPMYSALKVNGKKLYELARQGIEIERKPRSIFIYDIEVLKLDIPFVTLKVKCSKGTYIRSLCYDIGNELKCGGTMWSLERISSEPFDKSTSIPLEYIINGCNLEDYIISIEDALSVYERLQLSGDYEKMLTNGVTLTDSTITKGLKPTTIYRVYTGKNFIGLGKLNESGFKIVKLLN
jgi:tRNA pseudouridine55 synthase